MVNMSETISVCMIVKNESKFLSKTLPNMINGADEVIIVDTGSADETKDIAKKLGAKVFDYKWNDDFAAARNESIKRAKSDWIIWLDADEYVETEDLLRLKDYLHDTNDVYKVKIAECLEYEKSSKDSYLREKIFRNNIGIHFKRPINENLFF